MSDAILLFGLNWDFPYNTAYSCLATLPSQLPVILLYRLGLCNTFLHGFLRCCCKSCPFATLLFLFDPAVPPTNTSAEQSIRQVVIGGGLHRGAVP